MGKQRSSSAARSTRLLHAVPAGWAVIVAALVVWQGWARAASTPPEPPWSVAVTEPGGAAWTMHNDFRLDIGEPRWPATRVPVVAVWIQLCPAGLLQPCQDWQRFAVPADQQDPTVDGVSVPASGEWIARVVLEDQTGAVSFDQYNDEAHLRFDGDPPSAAFGQMDPHDPVLLSAQVHDALSGVQWAHIGLAPHGTGGWEWLNTSTDGATLQARVDDSLFRAGRYDEAVEAFDLAGNRSLVVAQDAVLMPLRTVTMISAGVTTRKGGVVSSRGAKRGRSVLVAGALRTAAGEPIPGAQISIRRRAAASGSRGRVIGLETTDVGGRFSHPLRASESVRLTFSYTGDDFRTPSRRTARLIVPAASTITVSRRSARSGQTLNFSGVLGGGHIPARGKLVFLDQRFKYGWQSVAAVRTDRAGRWRAKRVVRGAAGLIRFRAHVPRDSAYPFEPASSRTVRVTLLGP